MKAVKTEQSLAAAAQPAVEASRLSKLRTQGSAMLADAKVKAMDVAELATVKVQSMKVKATNSAAAAKTKATETASGLKQMIMVRVNSVVETAQSCKSAVDASYQRLRSQGVKAWASDNLNTLRAIALSQYTSTMAGVAGFLRSTKDSVRSRAAALVAGVKSAYVENLNKTVKALDTAKAKAKDTALKAKSKAVEVSGKAKEVASDKGVQATAAGAAVGAATTGATGLVTGTVAGAAVGLVPALFTFGLSIPIGAAICGGAGLAVGSAAGAVGGGAAGRVAYSKRNEINEFKDGALKKASSGVSLMKGKAATSAGYLKEKASEARERLVGKKTA